MVAILTDHCCHLIVKTKHHAKDKILLNKRRSSHRHYETLDNRKPGVITRPRSIDYEPIQTKESTPLVQNASNVLHTRTGDNENDGNTTSKKEYMLKHMTYGDIGKLTFGCLGVGLVNFSIGLTQFGFCVGYFILIGNTIHSLFPEHLSNTTNRVSNFSSFESANEHANNLFAISTEFPESKDNASKAFVDLGYSFETTTTDVTPTYLPNTTSSKLISSTVNDAPDLRILVAASLPLFIILVLIRSVRYLGIISFIANTSMLIGILAVIGFLLSGNGTFSMTRASD